MDVLKINGDDDFFVLLANLLCQEFLVECNKFCRMLGSMSLRGLGVGKVA